MASARAARLVILLSGLAGGGLAAPNVLGDARLVQIGPPMLQEGLSSMSESPEGPSSTWVLYAAGSYCNASGSPQFVELPDGLTEDECQDAALANSNCGDLVQTNAPHGYNGNPPTCKCTEGDAPACSTALSSEGNNLYRYVAATPASTTATQATMVLYSPSRYCPQPYLGHATDLGTVSTVEECLSLAVANSNCVDLIQTNAPHGKLDKGEQPSCICTSTALCPLSVVAPTSVFNNIYEYEVGPALAALAADDALVPDGSEEPVTLKGAAQDGILGFRKKDAAEAEATPSWPTWPWQRKKRKAKQEAKAKAKAKAKEEAEATAAKAKEEATATAAAGADATEMPGAVAKKKAQANEATTWMVEFSYTATETLPIGVTSSRLMASPTYIFVKKTGVASALNALDTDHAVTLSDITITGCSVNAANVLQQYVNARVAAGSTVQYSVSTSGTIQVVGESEAKALSNTIKGTGTAAKISSQTNSAAAVADWSGDQLFNNVSPTRRDQGFVEDVVDGQALVIEALTPAPTTAPTAPPTASPTAPSTGGSAQATGDPHLANVLGQRFDLRKEGWHTLVRVPQGAKRKAALLSVEAEARQMGVACADLYFQSVNLTGRYVGSQGRAFNAGRVAKKDSQRWLRYGMVELKVVQGHTKSGIVYLNLFVRHLKSAGYPVGGILGMDDHTAAAEPSLKCQMRISLLAIDGPVLNPEKASIAAADLE